MAVPESPTEGPVAARRTLSLLVLVVTLAAGSVPALGQDFNFTAVPRVTFGLSNQGIRGGVCSTGVVSFGPGGVVLGGSDVTCNGVRVPIEDGSLTIVSANRSVVGVVGGEVIIGQLLPAGHGFVAVDTLPLNSSIPAGLGLTAFVESNGVTFTQGDLTGTWRVRAMTGEQGLGGFVQALFGSITFAANGSVGGTLNFLGGGFETIVGGNVTVAPSGELTGFVTATQDELTTTTNIQALMAPDRNLVAGVTFSDLAETTITNGMFFLQRAPTVGYAPRDLAGRWAVFALQGVSNDSSDGTWFKGIVAFDAAGNIIPSQTMLTNAFGLTFPSVSTGDFDITSQGLISGSADFVDGSFLSTQATMFQDKKQIIGVNSFFGADETETLGLFTMFKLGPPPLESRLQFSASTYSVPEGSGATTATIMVRRGGATSTAVSVDITAFDDSTEEIVASGTVSFAPGQTSRQFSVPILGNNTVGADRIIDLQLSNPTNGAILIAPFTATLTVRDDDSTFAFAQTMYEAKESDGQVSIAVTRDGALAFEARVGYVATPGTALTGKDDPVPGTLVFPKNVGRASFVLRIFNNKFVDGNRTVFLTLIPPGFEGARAKTGIRPAEIDPLHATLKIVDDDQPGVVRMGSPRYSVKEGAGFVDVDIIRQPAPGNRAPLGGNVSIDYATSSGNASAGSDFTHVSGFVTFSGTETRKLVRIPILPDALVEGREVFFFNLGEAGGGATLGSPSSATIFIEDDDVGGRVFLSAPSYKVNEGAGNVSITVVRSGGRASNVSVDFATMPGTATDGRDRAPLGPRPAYGASDADYGAVFRTLTFAEGEMSKTVVIPIFQDGLGEDDEVFHVVLSNPQGLILGSPFRAPVTIVDDEVVIQFSGKFRNNQPEVVRTGPAGANVSVEYVAESGTAILGEDFILPRGTLIFPPGVRSRLIPIKTVNDNIAEGPETFTITLFNPSPPAQLGPRFSEVFTLDDNDFGGTVSFSNRSFTANIGATPVRIARAGGAGTVMTVGWSVIGGTASSYGDFSPSSGQVTFGAGDSSQTFTINTTPSAAGKTIVFGLTIPGGGAAKLGSVNTSTLTVLTPPPSVVQFERTAFEDEEGTPVNISVQRTGTMGNSFTVNWSVTGGNASAESDFSPSSGTLTFGPRDTEKVISLTLATDALVEGTEAIVLGLSIGSGNAVVGPNASATILIDDVPPAVLAFKFGDYRVGESDGFATIQVTRAGNLAITSTVDFATSDGSAIAGDTYLATSGTLTFPPMTGYYQVMSFMVPVRNNDVIDGPVTVNLRLGNVSAGSVLGEQSAAVLTIDDTPAAPAGYSFTVLYSGGVTVGLPSISDNGQFAFSIESGSSVVYSGTLEAPTDLRIVASLPGEGLQSIAGSRFPVDGGENVAFLTTLTLGNNAIVLDSNSSAPTIVFEVGPGILSIGEPALSFNGTLAFQTSASLCEGPCDQARVGTTSTGFSIAARTGDTAGDTFLSTIGPITAVNDSGLVAFTATTSGGTFGIFTGSNSSITTIASSAEFAELGSNVAINNAGNVAFVGTDFSGIMSVRFGSGDGTFVVASNASEFTSFPMTADSSPVIGNNGAVAFVADRTNGVRGIYTGQDPVANKVVEVGDIVDGRRVVNLRVGGINAAGQISFLATLEPLTPPFFGEVAAIVATPPPPPVDCNPECRFLRPARR